MESALDNAITVYPHIDNTRWETDSDETPESATEQLRDIIDSLFELAPSLDDQLKKLECATPKIDHVTRFQDSLVAESLLNTPAHDRDCGLLNIDLATMDDETGSGCGEVTPWESPQPGLRLGTGPATSPLGFHSNPISCPVEMRDEHSEQDHEWSTAASTDFARFVRAELVKLVESKKLLGGEVSFDFQDTIVRSICREAEDSYV